MRRPPSRGRDPEQPIEKQLDMEIGLGKPATPTLNRRNTGSRSEFPEQNSSLDKPRSNDLDPLETLSREEHKETRRVFEEQF
jgi:hypothetical protein